MPTKIETIDRDTPMLLPPDMRDWVPEDDMVHFVIEAVERVGADTFALNTRGSGSAQKSPHMMLGLLIYCYSNGIFSSRRIERATYRDVAVRYLTGDTHPDHDTICKFRRENLQAVSVAFVEILQLAREVGVLKLGKVSTDGTHIKASAAMNQNIGYGRAVELKAQLEQDIASLLSQAEEADRNGEDEQSLPEELARRSKLLSKMDEAIAGLKKRAEAEQVKERAEYEKKVAKRKRKARETGKKVTGKEPKAPTRDIEDIAQQSKATHNLTDPASRVMRKSKHGAYTQSINAQASVDAEGSFLILGQHLSQNSGDFTELARAYKAIPAVLGKPEAIIADAGFMNAEAFEEIAELGCEPYVSVSSENDHNQRGYEFRPPEKIKPPRNLTDPVLLAMKEKLKTDAGKAVYKLRSQTVETVFGIIKEVMGFRSFGLRGLEKMQGEWELVCMAYNCKRLHKMMQKV
jgi:transposase